MPSTDRGRDTSNALTDIRAVLSRAQTTRRSLDGPTEMGTLPDGRPDRFGPRVDDPDAAEMRVALDEVIRLLGPWARTGRPR